MKFRWLLLPVMLAVFSFPSLPARAADDPLQGPWEQAPGRTWEQRRQGGQDSPSVASGFFCSLLGFFQRVISPVDGSRCPSYPTCSNYSMQAYKKHGALLGTLMTLDRLIHEASEARFAPMIEVNGVQRIYDPLAANEFWKTENTGTRSR
ncbi:MAG: membrane protein insertion efficiency factor YidD [Syntrophobacteria bacterium]